MESEIQTRLMQAVEFRHTAELQQLIGSSSDRNRDCAPALIRAIEVGNEQAVELFIQAGVDVRRDHDQAFSTAAYHGRIAILEMLVGAGVNVSQGTSFLQPLGDAHVEVLEWLFAKGARLDTGTLSPFFFAIEMAIRIDHAHSRIPEKKREACIDVLLREALKEPFTLTQGREIMDMALRYKPYERKAVQWMADFMANHPPPPSPPPTPGKG